MSKESEKTNKSEETEGKKEKRRNGHTIQNLKRAVALSFRTKSNLSHIITVLSIVFAFLPVLLARQFQVLTDGLLGVLAGNRVAVDEMVWKPFFLVRVVADTASARFFEKLLPKRGCQKCKPLRHKIVASATGNRAISLY